MSETYRELVGGSESIEFTGGFDDIYDLERVVDSHRIGSGNAALRGAALVLLAVAVSACSSVESRTGSVNHALPVVPGVPTTKRGAGALKVPVPIANKRVRDALNGVLRKPLTREDAEFRTLQGLSEAELKEFIMRNEEYLQKNRSVLKKNGEELKKLEARRAYFEEMLLSFGGATPAFYLQEQRTWHRVWRQMSMAPDADRNDADDLALKNYRTYKTALGELEDALEEIAGMNEKEKRFKAANGKAHSNIALILRRLKMARSLLEGIRLDRELLSTLEERYSRRVAH
jgi:hypothetical protein